MRTSISRPSSSSYRKARPTDPGLSALRSSCDFIPAYSRRGSASYLPSAVTDGCIGPKLYPEPPWHSQNDIGINFRVARQVRRSRPNKGKRGCEVAELDHPARRFSLNLPRILPVFRYCKHVNLYPTFQLVCALYNNSLQ